MGVCVATSQPKLYRPRRPRESPLWRCLDGHFYDFVQDYPDKYEPIYGFFRPVVEEVVNKFIDCGDLRKGFATARCGECGEEFLVAFSCKTRYLCPSCHQKKVLLFGDFIVNEVAFPVPHRQYVFTIPKMLRIYFRNDRKLLGKLAHVGKESLLDFFRTVLDLPEGKIGIVTAIQTFGDFLVNFHPHLHSLVANGLFRSSGTFHVMPEVDTHPLEEMFRARVIKMLVEEDLLSHEMADKLRSWKNSGFSAHASDPIKPDQKLRLERTARYIMRNTLSLEKMRYDPDSATVIYRSDKIHPKSKRNFEIFSVGDFIAALTQHIPNKNAQMILYYGWYSNRARGTRRIAQGTKHEDCDGIEIIDVSNYTPKKSMGKKWRALIAKVYEDPLICPRCGSLMFIKSLTEDPFEIKKALQELGLWDKLVNTLAIPRAPPETETSTLTLDLTESQVPLCEIIAE